MGAVTQSLPVSIDIREVGPRDGLQSEAPVSVADRVALIEALVTAGAQHVEICSFVSPKAVPAMAGGAELVAALGLLAGVTRTALVPNLRGAEMAMDAGVDEITITLSASAVYSGKNVHMTIDQSVETVASIAALVAGAVPVDAVISCAFGSPYEGDIDPEEVAALAERVMAVGATSVMYADTTGMATPRRIAALLAVPSSAHVGAGLHLHDTRGTGLVNAYAGLLGGIRRFDTSVGGLGGSPFAAGAAGNVATEELVLLCDDLGVHTGFDLPALIEAAAMVAALVGHAVPSRVATSGPRLAQAVI